MKDLLKMQSLEDRIKAARPSSRLGVILDDSSSMTRTTKGRTNFEILTEAASELFDSCPNTELVLKSFSTTTQHSASKTAAKLWLFNLHPQGSTPLRDSLSQVLRQSPERVIVVSDGEPTDWSLAELSEWTCETPVDTVHIGTSTEGEAFMQALAEKTGGIFCKFRDVEALVRGLKLLSPATRPLLKAGQLSLEAAGASEVRL